ncbi:MAG: M36 family metallopeptidase [Sphingobacteriales bacterium]|nr:M36 family metallopeptidase [Sphingobacteriales bacterium]
MLVFLVFCLFAGSVKNDALKYLQSNKKEFALSENDIANLRVSDEYTDVTTGITHIWFQQCVNGIGLKNSSIALHFKDGKLIYNTSNGVVDLASKVNKVDASLKPEDALRRVAALMNSTATGAFNLDKKKSDNDMVFKPVNSLTDDLVYVKKLFYTDDKDNIRLAWEVYIEEIGHNHIWTYAIDANTGDLIKKVDEVVHCKVVPGMYGSSSVYDNIPDPLGHSERLGNGPDDQQLAAAQYRVYPYNVEAPTFGARQLLSDPNDVTASPYGWHDTNGSAGAEFTITRGNNVSAYQDVDANNVIDAGSQPNAGASLVFDYPIDFNLRMDSAINAKAAVTQLFYMNNMMHDIFYKYGFTEAAGNFQSNNYGRGGTAADFVYAEAHDGSGTDNANFSTPADGQKPRMQMYLWSNGARPTLTVNQPPAIAGNYDATPANFGPCAFNVTGSIVNAISNGSSPTSYVCSTISNGSSVSGKIALIDRGTCNFSEKVYYAQQAGAIGAIIINRQSAGDSLVTMASGTNGTLVTIPSLFVTYATGQILRNNIATAVVNMSASNCTKLDGDLDNGIVSHEYGHGISNRLAGGPSNSSCLGNAEQGGEGWSDFFALALSHRPGDTKNTARGLGTYVYRSSPDGIRVYPYSYDMSVNPWTYADVASIPDLTGGTILGPEVHTLGEVWCATIWDMYWNLIDKYGYSSDLLNGTAGNNRAIKLVIEGLKLQPCSGGFLDYRNAILKADSTLYGYADKCEIWSAFARRGMGYTALQGSANNGRDQTAKFDMPPSCTTTPTATASFTMSDSTVCIGGSLVFTNTSTASSGSPDSVRWTINGGTPSTSTSTTTVSSVFSTPGTYTITLRAYKAGNASAPFSKTIRVKSKPTVTVNSPTICSGQTATLTANGATSYTWTGGLSGNPATTPALTSAATYTVTGTADGCSNTAVASVSVTALPTVTVNSPTICSGQTATLTAGGATSYTWTGGLSGNPATTPALTGTATYTVTGTAGGCSKTAVATVTVTPLPSVIVNSPTICSGQTATLTAGGATSYTWTGGLTGNPATTPALFSTTTYTVTGTASGCTNTAVATVSVSSGLNVTVNSPTICAGQTATLTPNGATSYTWTGGLSGNPATTPALTGTTTYTVTGSSGACTGTAIATVTVTALPTVTVNSPTICSGQTATLTANGATSYTWTGGLSGNPATTPALTSAATYTVTGTADGCSNTAVASVSVTALPTVTVNSPTICSGQTATLTAGGATSYTWTGGLSGNPATTPALTGTATYTVTGTAGGCSKTAVATVTVTPLPSVIVNSPTICSGQTATLTAGGATSYTWTGGLTGNPATTPALFSTTTYTVTGTASGCTNTAVATVSVSSGLNVTVNSPTICAGQTATLTPNGATSYTWTGGLSGNPATTPALTGTTTYTVTGSRWSCTGTAIATVTVTALPTVTVNSPTICSGQTATLTANGATSYVWTGGLSGNPATTPALTSAATYTVTGTADGCSKTAVASVSVTALPTVTVNSPTICSGQTATLTAGGATSYTWTGGLSGNPATTPALTGTTTYTVTGTAGGCSKTAVATVTVTPLPTVTVNSPTICSGQTATLTAGGATSYTWTGGLTGNPATTPALTNTTTYTVTGTASGCTNTAVATVNVSSGLNVTVNSPTICAGQTATLTPNGATSYTWTGGLSGNPATTPALTGTTTYTVTGSSGACTGTAIATVTVTALPTVTVNSPTVCSGNTATLTADGATIYTWTGGLSGNPATTPALSNTTTYTVTGSTGSCSKTAVATVTVNSTPATPAITQSNDTLYSSTIVAGASYEWYKGGVLIATTSTPFYEITSQGVYTLKVKSGDCASEVSPNFSAIYTGIRNAANSVSVFEIYPNPTDGRLVLNLNLTKNSMVKWTIFSSDGREMVQKSYSVTKAVFEELNINEYAGGVYIIKLNVDNEVHYHKLVKE